MSNVEKLHVQGQCTTTNPGSATVEIPLPQLPATGAWSITGTVLARAQNEAEHGPALNLSLAFALTIAGNSVGGVASETDDLTPPYTILPSSGGLFGVSLTALSTQQTLYLTLNDAPPPAIVVWGWVLDVVALCLP